MLIVHGAVAAVGAGVAIAVIREHPEIARADGASGHGTLLLALAGPPPRAPRPPGSPGAWAATCAGGWRGGSARADGRRAAAAIVAGGLALPPAVPGALREFRARDATRSAPDPRRA